MLELQDIDFSYQDKMILQGFSLSVKPGERVALLGASGIGKTTLFRLITGYLTPDFGQVKLREAVALMSQDETLLPWKTILGNLLFLSKNKARALELLKLVGLSEYAESYPRSLSKGMRQRVALLRALLSEKPLLLLDEPFSALDPQTKNLVLPLITNYAGAVLLITHNEQEAEALGCRIVRL